MKKLNRLALSTALLSAMATSNVMAGPYGYDLHNVLAPVSASMAGTSIAKPMDNVSAVFGNPATLSEFRGTEFTFGATYYKDEAQLDHDGSVTGGAFSNRNNNEGYIVPQVAVTQDLRGLGLPATLGAGLTATSGIGVEYREEPNSLGLGAEYINIGANLGLSWDLTDNLTLGTAATLNYSMLDLGLAAAGAQTHDIAVKGSLGLTYALPHATQVGLFYHTELRQNFDDIVQISDSGTGVLQDDGVTVIANDGRYRNLIIEQPRTLGVGISNESMMDGNLYLAADIMYKNWANAEFWQDLYKDQWIFSMGAQMTNGPWEYRAGYGYATDPTRSTITGSQQVPNLCAGFSGNCTLVTVGQSVTELLAASQAQVIYRHRLTAGVGYQGFLAPFLDLDTHVGYQFEEERSYGTHSKAEVYSWHAGFALTWNFE